MPSVSSRALPAGAARTAQNLLARTNEFRPLTADTTIKSAELSNALVITNPKSLYRMDRDSTGALIATVGATGWTEDALVLNFVPGQINDNLTSRTYRSTQDGSIQPYVFDNTPLTKPLGIPPPSKPTTTHTVVNEYSTEEDTVFRKTVPLSIANAVVAAPTAMGTAPSGAPTSTTPGWLAHGTAVTGTLPTTNLGDWAFCVPMDTTTSPNTLKYLDKTAFLLDPAFGGKQITYASIVYFAVSIPMQGIGYEINEAGIATAIKAIVNPGIGGPLIPVGTADAAAANIAADYATTQNPQSKSIADINAAQKALSSVLTADNATLLAAQTKAFYSIAAVASEITKAISNFAKDVEAFQNDLTTKESSVNDYGP